MEKTAIDKTDSYISFMIGREHFAINVSHVLEILKPGEITHIPNASEFIPGVINFRGSIVPVIDLPLRFNLEKSDVADKMAVVVHLEFQEKTHLMALLVDQVMDVIEFDYGAVRAVPDLGVRYNPEFLEGFVEKDNRFIMVLNTSRVLNVSELAMMTATAMA
jgi:purine-binding chemotaxis protein CheW